MRFVKLSNAVGLAVALLAAPGLASAQSTQAPAPPAASLQDAFKALTPDPAHIKFILSQDIPWTGTPGRSQQYYITGAANQTGPYVMLLKWWPNNFSQPHMHEKARYVTVVSGTWWNSSSPVYDPDKTYPLPAGTVVIHEPNKVHWDGAKDEPVVLMIAGEGPATSIRVDANGNPVPRAPAANPPARN